MCGFYFCVIYDLYVTGSLKQYLYFICIICFAFFMLYFVFNFVISVTFVVVEEQNMCITTIRFICIN